MQEGIGAIATPQLNYCQSSICQKKLKRDIANDALLISEDFDNPIKNFNASLSNFVSLSLTALWLYTFDF